MALAYAPVLLSLPILLLVGIFTVVMGGFTIVFTVVMGGFLIILNGLYIMLVQIIGLVGLAARARRRPSRTDRPAKDRLVPGPITDRSPTRRVGALGATAMTAVLRSDQVPAPPVNE